MQLNAVKMTLIICLTIVLSAILMIAYDEYTKRYTLIATANSDLYIFDKKSGILNRCNANGCQIIETKLPADIFFSVQSPNWMSKMFSSQQNMTDGIQNNNKQDRHVDIEHNIKMPKPSKQQTPVAPNL